MPEFLNNHKGEAGIEIKAINLPNWKRIRFIKSNEQGHKSAKSGPFGGESFHARAIESSQALLPYNWQGICLGLIDSRTPLDDKIVTRFLAEMKGRDPEKLFYGLHPGIQYFSEKIFSFKNSRPKMSFNLVRKKLDGFLHPNEPIDIIYDREA